MAKSARANLRRPGMKPTHPGQRPQNGTDADAHRMEHWVAFASEEDYDAWADTFGVIDATTAANPGTGEVAALKSQDVASSAFVGLRRWNTRQLLRQGYELPDAGD